MRISAFVVFFLSVLTGMAQNLPVGKRTITYVDASRSNRPVSTDLFYPAASTGTNTPLAAGTEKYPVVVFGHGFVMSPTAYGWLADSLVKWGFIVAMPNTESGFSPSHEQFGRDLAFLAQRITSLTDSSGNFLFGRVLGKSAIGGHSMGGGCSFLGMTYNTQVQAVFNFAAAETNPSAKSAAATIQKPALIFSGSQDCIVAPSEQQVMYSNIPYGCKSYVNITGALHCQFGNNDGTCVLGQISSGCNNSPIQASVVFEKTISLLRPFLQHYLKADCVAANQFEAVFTALTGATAQRTCSSDPLGCVITSIPFSPNDQLIKAYPNPASASSGITVKLLRGMFKEITVLDASGKAVLHFGQLSSPMIRFTLPTGGIFLVRARTEMGIFYRRIVFHNE
ncbi:MAG: alpha/beta hydrolase [Bacteroidota bacterium]